MHQYTFSFYSLFGSASGGIGDIVLVLPVVGIRGKTILSELQDLVHGEIRVVRLQDVQKGALLWPLLHSMLGPVRLSKAAAR